MPGTYTVGDLVLLTATFVTSAGAPTDPTTVTFTIRAPDATITHPAASKVSTGVYRASQDVEQPGQWRWKATGTGSAQAASSPSQGVFNVVSQGF